MRTRRLLVGVLLVLASCAQATVETTAPSGDPFSPANDSPSIAGVDVAAAGICEDHVWTGIAQSTSFTTAAAAIGVIPEALTAAVRRHCPETFYVPLSRAEVDWCGDGVSFGQNFFRVVAAGVDLGIESFTVVEAGLISKAAARRVELTDYEIELLTAELQTMSESSRFERDWAAACRSTF